MPDVQLILVLAHLELCMSAVDVKLQELAEKMF